MTKLASQFLLTFVAAAAVGLVACGGDNAQGSGGETAIVKTPNTAAGENSDLGSESDLNTVSDTATGSIIDPLDSVRDAAAALPGGQAFLKGQEAFKADNLKEALVYFNRASSQNVYAADNYRGMIYAQLPPGDRDLSLSVSAFKRALTDTPRATPLVRLARAYDTGKGVRADAASALQYHVRVLETSDAGTALHDRALKAVREASPEAFTEANRRESEALRAAGGTPQKNLRANVRQALDAFKLYTAPGAE